MYQEWSGDIAYNITADIYCPDDLNKLNCCGTLQILTSLLHHLYSVLVLSVLVCYINHHSVHLWVSLCVIHVMACNTRMHACTNTHLQGLSHRYMHHTNVAVCVVRSSRQRAQSFLLKHLQVSQKRQEGSSQWSLQLVTCSCHRNNPICPFVANTIMHMCTMHIYEQPSCCGSE